MKKTIFTGSGCAIVTPMNLSDASINYDQLADLIDFQINGGTDAIVIAGTTGEASTFTDEEHVEVIRFAAEKVNKRVPLIAGAGSNDTRYAVWLSKEAEAAGADALLQVTPYYNKTSQTGLIKHFTAIADAVNIPSILYNVPSRTGMDIKPATYLELSKHPNIVATKEASGNLSAIAQTISLCGDSLDVYSGNDDQITPIMSLGGKGVISVLANIMPKETHDICQLFLDGKVKESAKLQIKLIPLINALFSDVNPIPVKEALNQMGKYVGEGRAPLCEMNPSQKALLITELKKYKLM